MDDMNELFDNSSLPFDSYLAVFQESFQQQVKGVKINAIKTLFASQTNSIKIDLLLALFQSLDVDSKKDFIYHPVVSSSILDFTEKEVVHRHAFEVNEKSMESFNEQSSLQDARSYCPLLYGILINAVISYRFEREYFAARSKSIQQQSYETKKEFEDKQNYFDICEGFTSMLIELVVIKRSHNRISTFYSNFIGLLMNLGNISRSFHTRLNHLGISSCYKLSNEFVKRIYEDEKSKSLEENQRLSHSHNGETILLISYDNLVPFNKPGNILEKGRVAWIPIPTITIQYSTIRIDDRYRIDTTKDCNRTFDAERIKGILETGIDNLEQFQSLTDTKPIKSVKDFKLLPSLPCNSGKEDDVRKNIFDYLLYDLSNLPDNQIMSLSDTQFILFQTKYNFIYPGALKNLAVLPPPFHILIHALRNLVYNKIFLTLFLYPFLIYHINYQTKKFKERYKETYNYMKKKNGTINDDNTADKTLFHKTQRNYTKHRCILLFKKTYELLNLQMSNSEENETAEISDEDNEYEDMNEAEDIILSTTSISWKEMFLEEINVNEVINICYLYYLKKNDLLDNTIQDFNQIRFKYLKQIMHKMIIAFQLAKEQIAELLFSSSKVPWSAYFLYNYFETIHKLAINPWNQLLKNGNVIPLISVFPQLIELFGFTGRRKLVEAFASVLDSLDFWKNQNQELFINYLLNSKDCNDLYIESNNSRISNLLSRNTRKTSDDLTKTSVLLNSPYLHCHDIPEALRELSDIGHRKLKRH